MDNPSHAHQLCPGHTRATFSLFLGGGDGGAALVVGHRHTLRHHRRRRRRHGRRRYRRGLSSLALGGGISTENCVSGREKSAAEVKVRKSLVLCPLQGSWK